MSTWPCKDVAMQTYYLNGPDKSESGKLDTHPGSETPREISTPQDLGLASGGWCAYGYPEDFPENQRGEDEHSLTFSSDPIETPTAILGHPKLTLKLSADRPVALVAARLCDVAPSGASALVAWGVLNLTHRESHEHPSPLTPGQVYDVTVDLCAAGYRIEAGHRWRVSISSTYWPMAWPPPELVTLTLWTGAECRMDLPVVSVDRAVDPFEQAEGAEPADVDVVRSSSHRREHTTDERTGVSDLRVDADAGHLRFQSHGLEYDERAEDRYRIQKQDPLSAEAVTKRFISLVREDWEIRIETTSRMWSDKSRFYVKNRVAAHEGDRSVFDRTWEFEVDRSLI